MLVAAAFAFSINWFVYKYWFVPSESWILLLVKTISIFAMCMFLYIIFAVLLRIEYVGELIERIKGYIKRKLHRS